MDVLEIKLFSWSYPARTGFSVTIASLDIPKNVAVYLTGPSGCGKSTFLNLLAGTLESPLEHSRSAFFPTISYITHQSTLAPWLRLSQNVRLEERLRGTQADLDVLARLLTSFRLDWTDLRSAFPRQLSLGMRQRFEIAKCLIFKPRLILVDEGFSGIDAATRDIVISEFGATLHEFGCTAIFTSHNIIDGLRLADLVVKVDAGNVSPARPLVTTRDERAKRPSDLLLRSEDAASLV